MTKAGYIENVRTVQIIVYDENISVMEGLIAPAALDQMLQMSQTVLQRQKVRSMFDGRP